MHGLIWSRERERGSLSPHTHWDYCGERGSLYLQDIAKVLCVEPHSSSCLAAPVDLVLQNGDTEATVRATLYPKATTWHIFYFFLSGTLQ